MDCAPQVTRDQVREHLENELGENCQVTTLPTQEEIVARYRERVPHDPLGFEVPEYLLALNLEHAKPMLKPGMKAWKPIYQTRDDVLQTMKEYMPFAWDKANGQRGISTVRSLMHYVAWLWLIGELELAEAIEDYTHYGKPQLVRICELFKWNWRRWDDDRWASSEGELGETATVALARLNN
jgi:hypothetical protein